jgi:alpha-L-fucosidase
MRTSRRTVLALGVALLALLAQAGPVRAGDAPAAETKAQRDQRMKWWREAKFGMFVHWGLYAIPGGEWDGKPVNGIGEWIMNNAKIPVADYEKLAGQFNPVKYDAKRWAQIAKDAGVRYIVITSKHHDGFCLWDSKVSNYDVMDATPFKRDILKELSAACQEQGLTLCFYHSIMDWHHPDAQAPSYPNYNGAKPNPNWPRYAEQYLRPQLKELLTNYGHIGVMWFDGEWIKDWSDAQGTALYNELRTIQPDLIINNRIGKSRKGMQGMSTSKASAGDFGTPEQEIPATGIPGADWESCMTMNDTWGFKKNDQHWKSAEVLIRNLVDIASKGGNFLLNVGPTPEGEIPAPSVERLAAVGAWMKVNAESIYATGPSPFAKLPWGRCTAKPGTLFLHVFNWPKDGQLLVPGLGNKVTKACLLAKPAEELKTTAGADGVTVALPAAAPDAVDSVVVLSIEGEPKVTAKP